MKATHLWIAGLATVSCAAVVLAVAEQPSIWESWRPATCMPGRCFCEAIREKLVRQPSNAISGLAFVGVGLLVLLSSIRGSFPVYPLLFASASILIGVGTTFYHASLTFWGQTADVLGMYLIATFIVLYNASRIRRLRPAAAAMLYVASNTILLAGLVVVPAARRYAFAGLILLALCLEIAARRRAPAAGDGRLFAAALGTLAFGFAIWTLDITRVVCSPQSWLQGHAVWHIAGAAATWLVFLYYKSTGAEFA